MILFITILLLCWKNTAMVIVTGYSKTDHDVTQGKVHFKLLTQLYNSHTHALPMHSVSARLS